MIFKVFPFHRVKHESDLAALAFDGHVPCPLDQSTTTVSNRKRIRSYLSIFGDAIDSKSVRRLIPRNPDYGLSGRTVTRMQFARLPRRVRVNRQSRFLKTCRSMMLSSLANPKFAENLQSQGDGPNIARGQAIQAERVLTQPRDARQLQISHNVAALKDRSSGCSSFQLLNPSGSN